MVPSRFARGEVAPIILNDMSRDQSLHHPDFGATSKTAVHSLWPPASARVSLRAMSMKLSATLLLGCLYACSGKPEAQPSHPPSTTPGVTALPAPTDAPPAPSVTALDAPPAPPEPPEPPDNDAQASAQKTSLAALFPAPPSGRRYATERTSVRRVVLLLCPNGRAYYSERKGKRSGSFTLAGNTLRVSYGKVSESYELTSDLEHLTIPDGPFLHHQGEARCEGEPVEE